MPDAPNKPTLSEALLDFAAAPGRHALRMGEPLVLFEAMDTLAQWALGRLPATSERQAEPERLRAAALLFITRACFAVGNSHYQLLGLRPHEVTPQRLRARYRALIGLTHPDRAIAGLPPDAAGMINRAHGVLADARLRADYDIQLAMKSRPRMAGQPGERASGVSPKRAASKWQKSAAHAAREGAPKSAAADKSGGAGGSAGAHVGPMLASMGRGLVRRGTFAHGTGHRIGQRAPVSAPGWLHRWSPTTVRVCLASVVLLACALGVLLWGLQGSGTDQRLVVTGQPQDTRHASAQPDETVQLRLPSAWARALDLPLSQVQMEDAPNGAAVPGAVGAGRQRDDAALKPSPSDRANGAQAGAATQATHATPGGAAGRTAQTTAQTASKTASSAATSATSPAFPSTAAMASAAPSAPSAASRTAVPESVRGSAAEPSAAPSVALSAPPSTAPSTAPSTVISASPSGAAGTAAAAFSAASPVVPNRANKAAERSSVDEALAQSAIIWDVDQERARAFLKDLLNQLQKPEQARSTNLYLKGMNVHGSLLRPAAKALRVQSADLLETHQPGVLRVQGVLQAQSEASERPARAQRFEVQAEFRGTHQGTVLTLLNMKELP